MKTRAILMCGVLLVLYVPAAHAVVLAQADEDVQAGVEYEEDGEEALAEDGYESDGEEPDSGDEYLEPDSAGRPEDGDEAAMMVEEDGDVDSDTEAEEAEQSVYDGADPNYDETGAPKTEAGSESGVYAEDENGERGHETDTASYPEEASGGEDTGYADAPDPYYLEQESAADGGGGDSQPPVSPFGAMDSGTGE